MRGPRRRSPRPLGWRKIPAKWGAEREREREREREKRKNEIQRDKERLARQNYEHNKIEFE